MVLWLDVLLDVVAAGNSPSYSHSMVPSGALFRFETGRVKTNRGLRPTFQNLI
jgi:hypothetical protein